MTIRTRMACLVVLLLFGCVFAAPYYHPEPTSKDEPSKPDLPTLQIRRDVANVSDEGAPWRRNALRPVSMHADEPSPAPDASFVQSFPDLEMPPPLDVHQITAKPISLVDLDATPAQSKSVTLIGSGIGVDASWVSTADSSSNSDATQSDMWSTENQRYSENVSGQGASIVSTLRPTATKTKEQTNEAPRWHRIVDGDTLQILSQTYYGSADHALIIFEANRQSLTSPSILPLGVELRIPSLSERREPTPLKPVSMPHF